MTQLSTLFDEYTDQQKLTEKNPYDYIVLTKLGQNNKKRLDKYAFSHNVSTHQKRKIEPILQGLIKNYSRKSWSKNNIKSSQSRPPFSMIDDFRLFIPANPADILFKIITLPTETNKICRKLFSNIIYFSYLCEK